MSWTLRLYQPEARSIESSNRCSTCIRKPSSDWWAFTDAFSTISLRPPSGSPSAAALTRFRISSSACCHGGLPVSASLSSGALRAIVSASASENARGGRYDGLARRRSFESGLRTSAFIRQ